MSMQTRINAERNKKRVVVSKDVEVFYGKRGRRLICKGTRGRLLQAHNSGVYNVSFPGIISDPVAMSPDEVEVKHED